MAIPPLSPHRLQDPNTLKLFVRVFSAGDAADRGTEHERLQIVPLVFGLLPRSSLARQRPDVRVKPIISKHLAELGIPADPLLVDVLKNIADQYFQAVVRPAPDRARKWGIEDVRALRSGVYERLKARQANRCSVCGTALGSDAEETLDHIIPWALAGDRFDASNWQLLCRECNLGKREWLSALQSPQALSWHYGTADALPYDGPTREARYISLAMAGRCQFAECVVNPRTGPLRVVQRHAMGLAVFDNLIACCENHAPSGEVAIDGELVVGRSQQEMHPVIQEKEGAAGSPPTHEVTAQAETTEGSFDGYDLGRRLPGGMAESFLAVDDETGEEVFLKRVPEQTSDCLALQREVQIYTKLHRRNAEHVPRVITASRFKGYFYIVTERAQTDLAEFVRERGHLDTTSSKQILREIIYGLREVHSLGIVHRDLKPSNILRIGDRWILADFGISKDRDASIGGATFQLRGTTGYAAPEQIMTGVEAKPSADVYSVGKIAVFLLTGGTDIDAVRFRQWRSLVLKCTADNASDRVSIDDIVALLEALDE